jgi:general secretion pathway protein H
MLPARRPRGFTLIELLVVMALMAVSVATVSLALRDPTEAQLEREAERLATLLEMARADSRADAVPVQWMPVPEQDQFRFQGLPPGVSMPTQWLGDPVQAQILGAASLVLGPEPIIGAQRVLLSLGSHQLMLATDGLSPFQVQRVP